MHKGKFKTFRNKGKFKQSPSPSLAHSASKPSTRQFFPNFPLLFGLFKTQTNQRQSFALCKLCQAKVRVETVGRMNRGRKQGEGKEGEQASGQKSFALNCVTSQRARKVR